MNILSKPVTRVMSLLIAAVMLVATLQISPAQAAARIPDGQYSLKITALKFNTDQASMADGYFHGPERLNVRQGEYFVSFKVTQSKEIHTLKVNKVDVRVVSEDKQFNTRIIEFKVDDLTKVVPGWVRIDWPAVNYHNHYDIHFKFEDIQPIIPPKPDPTPDPTPEPKPNPNPNPGTSPGGGSGGNPGGGSPSPGPGPVTPTPGAGLPDKDGPKTGGAAGTKEAAKGQAVAKETAVQQKPAAKEVVMPTDINSHWAKAAIEEAITLGFVSADANGNFVPNKKVNRGEVSSMFAQALNLSDADAELSFADSDNISSKAKDHVAQVVKAGIMNGYDDNTFRASKLVTRLELTVMIVRALGIEVDEKATLKFKDADQIPDWAKPYVAAALKRELVSGKGKNTFKPDDNVTKAEAVKMILGMVNSK
ncbi:S-layer homology domain-containing protein [Paenibacillus sp. 481]|uniref:S-layer homology domain-containing protein n=1 Tax=Paenibacillus sp. 481 TaxID=2835869 RepID=UPI001E2C7556|nr:S-layer homology domain-containing protein [Paenibacillus sp. 481]UHA74487.1 S-layer homology domain-containing protein [Paenibacillus sp. 481]